MEEVFNCTSAMVPRERYAHVYLRMAFVTSCVTTRRPAVKSLAYGDIRSKLVGPGKEMRLSVWPNESKGAEDANNGMVTKNRQQLPFWLTNSELATLVAQKRHSNIFEYLIIDCPPCFARIDIM